MVTWFWIWTTLREERREFAQREMQRRERDEERRLAEEERLGLR